MSSGHVLLDLHLGISYWVIIFQYCISITGISNTGISNIDFHMFFVIMQKYNWSLYIDLYPAV